MKRARILAALSALLGGAWQVCGATGGHDFDLLPELHAVQQVREGREVFRYSTFGDEDFWGGALGLHEAIAGGERRRRPGEPEDRARGRPEGRRGGVAAHRWFARSSGAR